MFWLLALAVVVSLAAFIAQIRGCDWDCVLWSAATVLLWTYVWLNELR